MPKETDGIHARKAPYRSVVLDFLNNFFRYRLTLMGRHLVGLGFILLFVSGFVFLSTFIIYSMAFFLVLIFLLNPIFCRLFNPTLKADVSTVSRAAAGETVDEEIILSNPSSRSASLILVREDFLPEGIETTEPLGLMAPTLPGKSSIAVKYPLTFQKRGSYMLKGIRIESPFPLGITKTGTTVKRERHLLVYPRFTPLLNMEIPAGRKLQPGGIALASRVGESTEFRSTREFRTGDDPRYIHWKSWARTNKPVIKEFHEEYYVRIALFLDTYLPPNSPKSRGDDFESLLSLGASISDYLQRQEYIVDIMAAGPQLYYLQAGRSLAYLDQILDILACLETCPREPYSEVAPHLFAELSSISTVVVLLLELDPPRRDFLHRLKEMGVELKVFVVTSNSEIYSEDFGDSLGMIHYVNREAIMGGGVFH